MIYAKNYYNDQLLFFISVHVSFFLNVLFFFVYSFFGTISFIFFFSIICFYFDSLYILYLHTPLYFCLIMYRLIIRTPKHCRFYVYLLNQYNTHFYIQLLICIIGRNQCMYYRILIYQSIFDKFYEWWNGMMYC
jgi:hypothetical protein